MNISSDSNYHNTLKKQAAIILNHYSTPIFSSISRKTSFPIRKKKLLNLKKTIKQQSDTNDSVDKQSKKQIIIDKFIIED